MNRRILLALGTAALVTAGAAAQSAVDAYTITPTQLRGTARFVSMGGAFTSLGSDLSCLTQNPAGIGMYRYSDIGLTFDASIRSYKSSTNYQSSSNSETKWNFDNFGYVGVANLSGALRSFQWGVSYSRIASFERMSSGYINPSATSLSNYVASFTQGTNSGDMLSDDNYDPYYDSSVDWLSTLAYNSYMISNTTGDESYAGLYQNGTNGDALYQMRETGSIDEYNIDFGGNVSDVVYWGIGVGIMDVNYNSVSDYSESMENALVYSPTRDALVSGNAGFNLYNQRSISGTGANLKLGVIVRPIEQLRIGVAIHTPTWLHLNHQGYGQVDYNYSPYGEGSDRPTNSGTADTPDYGYSSRLNTPWRFMLGASTVIGSSAIVSVDYERVAYGDMKLRQEGSFYGGYVDNTFANEDVKNLFRAANIVRVGLEYRISRNFSARAGYNWQSSALTEAAKSPTAAVGTSGTDPSFIFNDATNTFSHGLGYHYKSWYIDAAWQHVRRSGTYHAYTSFDGNIAPTASLTDNYNNIVISTGFRF